MNQATGRPKSHHHAGKSSERFINKELVLSELHILPGQIILDAGCGNGYMSKAFSRLVNNTGQVYAIDADSNSIAALKNDLKDTNLTPILGDITKTTPLAASSVDLIYAATVLHGFSQSDMDGFQKEVTRLLKPQGVLAIVEIKKEPTPFGPPLEIRFSPQELQEAIPLAPKKLVDLGEFFYLQLFEKKA